MVLIILDFSTVAANETRAPYEILFSLSSDIMRTLRSSLDTPTSKRFHGDLRNRLALEDDVHDLDRVRPNTYLEISSD